MALPILIYLAFNAGGSGANGWGAAMSTDTAFALGVLALEHEDGFGDLTGMFVDDAQLLVPCETPTPSPTTTATPTATTTPSGRPTPTPRPRPTPAARPTPP